MNAQEIREKIIETVNNNGGHMASSLGAVELAMAIVEVFDPEKDRIVWDVGHQAYAWKILTARDRKAFDTLRKLDGLAPFPLPAESKSDASVSGHAGVAISVAEGLAAARDARKMDDTHVVAIVGDGALANGVSFEALNNLSAACSKVIIVLNDNEMSISRPTGSLAKLLGRLITNESYNRVKLAAENAGHHLRLTFLRGIYHRIESRIKSLFLGNAYFEQFGMRYIGPVDGHNLDKLKAALTVAKKDKRSVIVHVVTKKGKGYKPAEDDPTKYHGIGPMKHENIKARSWSDAFGDSICELARKDDRIVALTAGMKDGTGLSTFAEEFPSRFHDVGIAEEHMVAYAAGMATGGLRPVVAIYSTFLQRAVDQIIHDICISNLPVVFCVDRAGAVGADGVTHQGVFDIALLRCIPNLTICQPKNEDELKALLAEALSRNGPTVIRYPRGRVPMEISEHRNPNAKIEIWATGDQIAKANEVAKRVDGDVVYARYLKPFNSELLNSQRLANKRIISIENGVVQGGFGESIGADIKFGWTDTFIPHGKIEELEKRYHFDVDSIAKEING